MHYVEEAEVTLSHRCLDHILNLMHLPLFYTTLLMPCMKRARAFQKNAFNKKIEREAVGVCVD